MRTRRVETVSNRVSRANKASGRDKKVNADNKGNSRVNSKVSKDNRDNRDNRGRASSKDNNKVSNRGSSKVVSKLAERRMVVTRMVAATGRDLIVSVRWAMAAGVTTVNCPQRAANVSVKRRICGASGVQLAGGLASSTT